MSHDPLSSKVPEFDPEAGMTDEARRDVAGALGRVLADSYMLFIKTQGVHWNVGGTAFYSIHSLTEDHYENLYEAIDVIAERIRALGVKAPASYTKYGELSEIKDEDVAPSAAAMLTMLINDHETTVRGMRSAIEWCEDRKDYVTADMLIARMAWHEEAIWMLKSIMSES
jgi:starvation-inducible DNA-binding protein